MPQGRKYSFTELIDLWIQAGGSMLYAPIAAAIAMAESGGRSDAINANNRNGSVDRGLWQINSIHGKQSTLDALNNAKAAVAISKGGTDWRPWCVAWSNGRCGGSYMGTGAPVLRHIPAGTNTNVGTVPVAGNRPPVIPGASPGTALTNFILMAFGLGQSVGDDVRAQVDLAVRSFKLAFAYMALAITGAAMMVGGLILLILDTRTVRKVAGFAADVGGQAIIYRSVIPDTPINIFGGQQEQSTVATPQPTTPVPPARDPFSAPIERPALAPPLTEPGTLDMPEFIAPRSPGGTFQVYQGTVPGGPVLSPFRSPLSNPPNKPGEGATFLGGKKGPPPPYIGRHKKKRVVSSRTGREVTDVSMNLQQAPGKHRGEE